MDKKLYRRRRYLIKRGMQFRYIGVMFGLAFLAAIVSGYTVFTTGWTLFGEKLAIVYPQGRLLAIFRSINIALYRNLLFIAAPFIFILGLLSSHKTAGPVYRIEKSLEEISKGNLTLNVRLRKGDELWDLAEVMNEMIKKLNTGITLNKSAVTEIKNNLDKIKTMVKAANINNPALLASLEDVEKKVQVLDRNLSAWVTS